MIWNVTKAIDPTRPSLEASGWTHTLPHPEVLDAHDYNGNPAGLRKKWLDYFTAPAEGPFPPTRYSNPSESKADRGVPFMISEIGGIGWATEGGWSYGNGPKNLDELYVRYQGTIDALLDNPNLFGFCYTQLTDIEQERNGLYYYDRKPKFDVTKIHAITARSAACERGEPAAGAPPAVKVLDAKWRVLVGAAQDGPMCRPYRYVTDKPADDWIKEGFDVKDWQTGQAPFSSRGDTKTKWKTPDIYFRQTFEYDGGTLRNGAVVISHNSGAEIYVNGQKILSVTGSKGYHLCVLTDELRAALKIGPNTLAVHSHEGGKGQWIDLALLVE